ncbi:MAG TPA: hypothetical protein DCY54_06235 [Parachlamydiales bacterium]|nr:MAG: hypothetical protein A2Z85_01950 [Chlamydiae bacterium GWA2_50_15]OGN54652.1 MAG: hypothetical protein A2098_00925 [Chlamydiae bacterium GWF2_49_8]OGN57622.1 MAG: hypothetical protein A3D18_00895 [Chlamydiae bacterium RIFCSPHIGHO2_02_FULL_49_29]OGN62910.1 MAG: hypothetical protein A3E26_01885 [Chlamydiae bacterium RIFCSPHIGHO2_12_FULL_49_32]OGN68007.1 MAG: hypothetical protein A3I15_04875 [Chlamydiae bacterium RIFCSPLOWO2_02_FULL_49_12]OGN71581.1 MAG: hypothetical protein A3G30_00265 [
MDSHSAIILDILSSLKGEDSYGVQLVLTDSLRQGLSTHVELYRTHLKNWIWADAKALAHRHRMSLTKRVFIENTEKTRKKLRFSGLPCFIGFFKLNSL